MKEKLKSIFNSEKLKGFSKKVFTKKKIGAAIAIVVLLVAFRIGFSLMFQVEGTVLKVDTKSIVVTNFLGTKTVNTGDYPIDSNRIIAGEKIKITKNLSGDVISIESGRRGRGGDNNRLGGLPGRDGKLGQGQNGGNLKDRQGVPGKGVQKGAGGTDVQKPASGQ